MYVVRQFLLHLFEYIACLKFFNTMKSNFKSIIVSILVLLCIVFLVQLFWLRGLYNSIEQKVEKDIWECLNIANSEELEYRMDSLEHSSEKDRPRGELSISQSMGGSDNENVTDKGLNEKQMIKSKRVIQAGDTIEDSKESIANEEFSLAKFEDMGRLIRETIHQAVDSLVPIQLDTLHSSFLSALHARELYPTIYKLEVVSLNQDSVMKSLIVIDSNDSPYVLNYVYDTTNQLAYRIHFASLTSTVLSQMLGILLTTLAIVVTLAFAFWYLIRTIFQQKTLDEMKDDFINNMTHELKTPIAVAYSATDVLLNFRQGDDKEKREKYLAITKGQLENLSSLVEQILSMSVERRLKLILKKESIDTQAMLEVLIDQHRMKADKVVDFKLDIQPEGLTVFADKSHLTNVMSNLIDNAIKYSKNDAVVSISASEVANYTLLQVRDKGIGIEEDKLKYVFDKFYRVPQGNRHNAKGYGIGLFYVKTIVEKHGGSVTVESTPHEGTIFTIKLPKV